MRPADQNQTRLALAKVCLRCPVCRRARKEQRGLAYWLTSKVEGKVCPFCRAYEQVYGRKPHEPLESAQNRQPSPPV